MDERNNDNLNFETKKIQFFPEDIKAMETMTLEEKIEFKHKLKKEHRYIVL